MDNPLTRKLENYVRLSEADRAALEAAVGAVHRIGPRGDILLEGDDPRVVNVVLDGWACRYKQFEDGRRQIVAFLLPGDACDPQITLLNRLDHGLAAVTPVTVAQIPGRVMREMTVASPALETAFHRERLVTAAIQREWTASLGRRSAIERLAHLFCELHRRLAGVGLAEGETCPMPLTQPDLADALGQTSVHINRTLQDLRYAGLLVLKSRRLTILDEAELSRLAHFSPAYLEFSTGEDRPVTPYD